MEPRDERAHAAAPRPWVFWGLPSLWTAAAATIDGYRFGTTDQAIHLTLLRRLVEPAAMSGDLIASHADAHASLWWHLQVPAVRLVGWEHLDALYLATYVVCLAATFALLQRIAWELLEDRWAALLAPAALVVFKACPAHVFTFEPELINRTFTHPLVLWGVLALLRGRVTRAAAICGLSFNLHASTASHALAAIAVAALLDPALRRRLPQALAAFALCSGPMWTMLALRGGPGSWWVDPEWMHVLQWRMPHHLFPGRWPAAVWGVAAFQVTLWAVASRQVRPGTVRLRYLGIGLGVLACGPLLGTVVAGPLPLAPLLGLHLWESWILLAVMAYLAAPGLVAALVRQGGLLRTTAGAILALLLLVGIEAHVMDPWQERAWHWRGPTGARLALIETLDHPSGSGEMLLVPPTGMTWLRPWTGRSLWVTVKDGGETLFDRDMALQWRSRLAALCGEDILSAPPPRDEWRGYRSVGRRADEAFARLPDAQLRRLASENRTWLLVLPQAQQRPGLSSAFENGEFVVYDLRVP